MPPASPRRGEPRAGASQWLASSARLGLALAWRIRRESVRYLLAVFVPFGAVLALITVVPLLRGGQAFNGANTAAAFGLSQGAHANSATVGLVLIFAPALVALFSAMSVARLVQGLVGADVSRGALEALLSAPYTPGNIAAGLLGIVAVAATAFWAVMSGLAALDILIVVAVSGDHLSLSGGYVALALVLPLLSALAGGGLTLLGSLLFPGATQLGATVSVAGGNLSGGLALLPALGVVLAMTLGAEQLGPARLLVYAGGGVAIIDLVTLALVAWKFRPDAVLGS